MIFFNMERSIEEGITEGRVDSVIRNRFAIVKGLGDLILSVKNRSNEDTYEELANRKPLPNVKYIGLFF